MQVEAKIAERQSILKKREKVGKWVSEKFHNIVVLYFFLSILFVVGIAAAFKYELFKGGNIIIENAHAQTVKQALRTELAKKSEPVKKDKTVDELVEIIFEKESSKGKKNYSKCEAIGKFNRYGFDIPGDGTYVCFDGDGDKVATTGWVAHKKALGYSDNELLCYYNSGDKVEDCGYLH